MRYYLILVLVLFGCHYRDITSDTALKLSVILGERVDCLILHKGEGTVCRSESKRNFYCPYDVNEPCFFTNRIVLIDAPVEAPLKEIKSDPPK